MRWTIVVPLLAAIACSSDSAFGPQVSAVLDESFALRVGQQVSFGSEPLRILFESVGPDSRCAIDVVCFWQGNARVRLRATTPDDGTRHIDLDTATRPQPASLLDYEISIQRLDPEPVSTSRTRQDQYVLHLIVTRQ